MRCTHLDDYLALCDVYRVEVALVYLFYCLKGRQMMRILIDSIPFASGAWGDVHAARIEGSERYIACKRTRPGGGDDAIKELQKELEAIGDLRKKLDFDKKIQEFYIGRMIVDNLLLTSYMGIPFYAHLFSNASELGVEENWVFIKRAKEQLNDVIATLEAHTIKATDIKPENTVFYYYDGSWDLMFVDLGAWDVRGDKEEEGMTIKETYTSLPPGLQDLFEDCSLYEDEDVRTFYGHTEEKEELRRCVLLHSKSIIELILYVSCMQFTKIKTLNNREMHAWLMHFIYSGHTLKSPIDISLNLFSEIAEYTCQLKRKFPMPIMEEVPTVLKEMVRLNARCKRCLPKLTQYC